MVQKLKDSDSEINNTNNTLPFRVLHTGSSFIPSEELEDTYKVKQTTFSMNHIILLAEYGILHTCMMNTMEFNGQPELHASYNGVTVEMGQVTVTASIGHFTYGC